MGLEMVYGLNGIVLERNHIKDSGKMGKNMVYGLNGMTIERNEVKEIGRMGGNSVKKKGLKLKQKP